MFKDNTNTHSGETYYSDAPIGGHTIILHDAPAGAGKTYALCQMAAKMVSKGESIIFVQPTKELIGKTINEIKGIDQKANVKRIDTDNVGNAIESITQFMKDGDAKGMILFITHASFERIPYFYNAWKWNLFIDEVLQPHHSVPLRFQHTHKRLTNVLETNPVDATWSVVSIEDTAAAADLRSRAKTDDGLQPYLPALNFLTSKHWQTYVHSEDYSKLLNGVRCENGEATLFAALKPSICSDFKSVRIAGAHISDSSLVKLWQLQGCHFRNERLEGLRYQTHENCERITIYYGFERDWSKHLRQKYEKEAWIPLLEKCSELFKDTKFLYGANKSEKSVFSDSLDATRLPNFPHGLNDYMDRNIVAYLPALNPAPRYKQFLKFFNLSDDEIRLDFYYSKAYQAVMRGGIRKPKDTEHQIIVVPEKGLAEWLHTIFPGSAIKWLGIELSEEAKAKSGRKKIHASNSAKTKAYRKRISNIDYGDLYSSLIDWLEQQPSTDEIDCHNSCNETHYISADKVNRFYATIWDNTYSKFPRSYLISSDHNKFVDKLREYSKLSYDRKEDNSIFTVGLPAHDAVSMRPKEKFVIANGLVFDNDGGGISPEAFASIMSGFEIYIFNTFSSTPDKPRWRAYIPTETVMPPNCYREIISRIFDSLKSHGFEKHGFDNKKWPSDMMYLPCQAAHPDGSFFLEFRGPERGLLDPRSWISFEDVPENLNELVEKAASERTYRPSVEQDFEEDIQRWRTEGNVPGKRNHGWSDLYFALINKGFRFGRIKEIMTAEAYLISRARERNRLLAQLERLLK
jgi:hypothetical protein